MTASQPLSASSRSVSPLGEESVNGVEDDSKDLTFGSEAIATSAAQSAGRVSPSLQGRVSPSEDLSVACDQFLEEQAEISDMGKLQLTLSKRFGQSLSPLKIVKKCPKLTSLDLQKWPLDDEQFAEIAKACPPSLETLVLVDCNVLINPDFSALRNLRHLHLGRCKGLQTPNFKGLEILEEIAFNGSSQLQCDFSPLIGLRSFYWAYCQRLNSDDFKSFVNLENLELCFGKGGRDFDLSPLVKLKDLRLVGCEDMQNITVKSLVNIEQIDLHACSGLKNPDFSHLEKLYRLALLGCTGLENPNFNGLVSLARLNIGLCSDSVRLRQFTSKEIPSACSIDRGGI
jgi:hypothetical protein